MDIRCDHTHTTGGLPYTQELQRVNYTPIDLSCVARSEQKWGPQETKLVYKKVNYGFC